MNKSDEERLDRERSHHERRYTSTESRPADRFYSVFERNVLFYRSKLQEDGAGRHILEYGCGLGSSAFMLAEAGNTVTGIDLSPTAISHAAAKALKMRSTIPDFRVMNAEQLLFDSETFDMVCGTAILHHLNLQRAYSEVARVLKPRGVGIFMEPLGHNIMINAYRQVTPTQRTRDEHPLMLSDLADARQFFDHVEVHYFHLLTLMAVPFRRRAVFKLILPTLEAADAALFRWLPYLRRYAWYAVLIFRGPQTRLRRFEAGREG